MPSEVPELATEHEASTAPDGVEHSPNSGEAAPETSPLGPVRRSAPRQGRRTRVRVQAVLALAVVGAAIVCIAASTLAKDSGSPATSRPRTTLKISFHHVEAGNSLDSIAARYHSSVAILEQLNPTVSPQDLHPGEVLRVATIVTVPASRSN